MGHLFHGKILDKIFADMAKRNSKSSHKFIAQGEYPETNSQPRSLWLAYQTVNALAVLSCS
jgi:hypothetical protein